MSDTETAAPAAEKKSIVPSKYSGKYKSGGDAVAEFMKAQTEGNLESLFALCRANGIDEAKVAHYAGLYADKANNHGIEGRARMTLGNMLRAKARKEGKLSALNGNEQTFEGLAKPAVSGAAAAAKENAEAKTEDASETQESAADPATGDETTE